MPPTAEELEAGIKTFEKFGEFNIIYSLANGDVTKYNEVFNIEYNDAFLTMYRKAEEARFQKKYSKILQRKNK